MNILAPAPLLHRHLSPGQLVVSSEPQVITTVLGSCVAVTMFARHASMAAICHAMLARPQLSEHAHPNHPERYRFVSHVLPAMLAVYHQAGIAGHQIEVKLFGGANLITQHETAGTRRGVGGCNVAAVRAFLQEARLVLSAENTGGFHGRKILFNTATGEVLHKHLRPASRHP